MYNSGNMKNKSLTMNKVSLIFLCFSIVFFFYYSIYNTARKNQLLFKKMHIEIKQKVTELENKQNENKNKESSKKIIKVNERITDIPDFLIKLNDHLIDSKLELFSINKSTKNAYAFEIIAYASFETLVDFLKLTEIKNIAFQNIDIFPFSDTKNQINFTVQTIQNKMRNDELDHFNKLNEEYNNISRNPFIQYRLKPKPCDPSSNPNCKKKKCIRWWTNLKRLYSISPRSDGEICANIDHETYCKGDILDNAEVISIRNDMVILKKNNCKYIIGVKKQRQKQTNNKRKRFK